ncbi:MAG TPA: flavin reductase family protein [Bacteroidales bacterium]|nr:flavin reductase family protein [Bacteroidales bacterium]
MAEKYTTIGLDKAYRLLNTGAVGIICTRNNLGNYNMAPAAWITPIEYDPVTRVVIVLDKENRTCQNILESGIFAIAIPHISQVNLVKDLGSVSGHVQDKISHLGIHTIPGTSIDVLLPQDCIGYIECKLYRSVEDDGVMLLFGEAVHARVLSAAFDRRLLAEKPEGKAVHHLGGKVFVTSSDVTY